MRRWKATRLHIPTGKISEAEFDALTRKEALEQVNAWNASLPGTWQYWLIDEGRPV